MAGEKDVPGITTIHHALGDVDSSASHVCPLIHVHDTADRPAVDAHANLQPWMLFKRAADLHGALCGLLWALVEDQGHSVPGGDFKEAIG